MASLTLRQHQSGVAAAHAALQHACCRLAQLQRERCDATRDQRCTDAAEDTRTAAANLQRLCSAAIVSIADSHGLDPVHHRDGDGVDAQRVLAYLSGVEVTAEDALRSCLAIQHAASDDSPASPTPAPDSDPVAHDPAVALPSAIAMFRDECDALSAAVASLSARVGYAFAHPSYITVTVYGLDGRDANEPLIQHVERLVSRRAFDHVGLRFKHAAQRDARVRICSLGPDAGVIDDEVERRRVAAAHAYMSVPCGVVVLPAYFDGEAATNGVQALLDAAATGAKSVTIRVHGARCVGSIGRVREYACGRWRERGRCGRMHTARRGPALTTTLVRARVPVCAPFAAPSMRSTMPFAAAVKMHRPSRSCSTYSSTRMRAAV